MPPSEAPIKLRRKSPLPKHTIKCEQSRPKSPENTNHKLLSSIYFSTFFLLIRLFLFCFCSAPPSLVIHEENIAKLKTTLIHTNPLRRFFLAAAFSSFYFIKLLLLDLWQHVPRSARTRSIGHINFIKLR